MTEKRNFVDSDEFEMNWEALEKDYELLGDWPDTVKPKDSADPTWKVPNERGQRVLVALATKMGRKGESTRGVRTWLLANQPVNLEEGA